MTTITHNWMDTDAWNREEIESLFKNLATHGRRLDSWTREAIQYLFYLDTLRESIHALGIHVETTADMDGESFARVLVEHIQQEHDRSKGTPDTGLATALKYFKTQFFQLAPSTRSSVLFCASIRFVK